MCCAVAQYVLIMTPLLLLLLRLRLPGLDPTSLSSQGQLKSEKSESKHCLDCIIMLPSHIYFYLAPTLSILFQTFRCFYILINVREPGGFYQRIRDKYTEAY